MVTPELGVGPVVVRATVFDSLTRMWAFSWNLPGALERGALVGETQDVRKTRVGCFIDAVLSVTVVIAKLMPHSRIIM